MRHIVGRPRHRLNLVDGVIASIKLNELIDWVLPRFDTLSFVAGFRSGLHILDIETGEWRLIGNAEADRPGNHLNDAKADAQSHLLDAGLRGAEPCARALFEVDTGCIGLPVSLVAG